MEKQFTREGLEKLKKELEYLKNVERKKIAERLKKAAGFGDLSENAEYAEAKDSQAFLEGKIRELETLLENTTIVSTKMRGIAQIGSIILVKSKINKETLQLVGAGEVSPLEGKISIDSPLGKSLLNKPEGAVITIATQKGKIQYKILKVE
jgi:transcription elongation factor GreA